MAVLCGRTITVAQLGLVILDAGLIMVLRNHFCKSDPCHTHWSPPRCYICLLLRTRATKTDRQHASELRQHCSTLLQGKLGGLTKLHTTHICVGVQNLVVQQKPLLCCLALATFLPISCACLILPAALCTATRPMPCLGAHALHDSPEARARHPQPDSASSVKSSGACNKDPEA